MATGATFSKSAGGKLTLGTPKPKAKAKTKPKATAGQKAARQRRAARRALYDPTQVLAGHNLKAAVNNLVRGEINPQVSELGRQVNENRLQGQQLSNRASDYYRQLAMHEAQNLATQQAISDRLGSNLANVAGGTQQALTQAGQGAQAAVSQDAAQRGAGLEGGSREAIAREIAAQQARAAQTGQAYQSSSALARNAAENYALQSGQSEQMRGGEVQGQIAGNQQKRDVELMSKLADVRASAGPLRTKLLTQLRSAGFDQLATQVGLNIKQADLQAQINQDAVKNKQENRRINLVKRGQNITAQNNIARQRIAEINSAISQGNLDERHRSNLVKERQGWQRLLNQNKDKSSKTNNDVSKAVGSLKAGTVSVNGKNVPIAQYVRTHPGYASTVHAQLQAKYGKRVADQAMRRFQRTVRGSGGGILSSIQETIGNLGG
jgi:hypothetical protein